VSRGLEVLTDRLEQARMYRNIPNLRPVAVNPKMLHVPSLMQVFDLQCAEFGPAHRVIKEHRQDRAIAFCFQAVALGGIQSRAHLGAGERRRLAFVTLNVGSGNTFHRVVRYGVALSQVFK